MQFGIYLVENGVISCDEFYEALKYQQRTRPPLGELAVERRKLTRRQVSSVLQDQCEAPAEYFGALAVKAGFLTGDEMARLSDEQTAQTEPFGAVLVELGILRDDEAERHAREYRRIAESYQARQLAAMGG